MELEKQLIFDYNYMIHPYMVKKSYMDGSYYIG